MNINSNHLFVYGTLMQGYANPFAEQLRRHATYEGFGSFSGALYKVSWYPGAVYIAESDQRVYGEIYELSAYADLLPELDEYEDIIEDEKLSLYLRRIVPVTLENGSVLNCWTYLYNQTVTDFEKIEHGDFRNYS
jgi:gamma-glutamylcyclotransferase (GGCT)/AIG2-like uncharacterized protein YtfP